MTQASLQYPSPGFLTQARGAFIGAPVEVTVNGQWRRSLLQRVIADWSPAVAQRTRQKSHWLVGPASVLLFSLFHGHVVALTAGYQVEVVMADGVMKLRYRR